MDRINLRVLLKEPRGFIRLLQVLFSILAWSTTARFSTSSILHVDCPPGESIDRQSLLNSTFSVEFKIAYPFDLRNVEVQSPFNCSDVQDTSVVTVNDSFPIDFSATSMLYVAICALSLFYALASAVYYCVFTARYETNPLAPMVDLCITLLFTIAWVAITCTWALNVSDLKHFTHPNYFKEYLSICQDVEANCQITSPGKWTSLTVSISCGFTCIVLWLGSTWFIFKETSLHKKQTYQAPATQQPQKPI